MRSAASMFFILVVISAASAQTTSAKNAKPSTAPAPRAAASQPTAVDFLRLLDRRISSVEMRDAPLSEAVAWIESATGMLVYVRWSVLKASGITPDSPVTIRAKDRRLEDILSVILQEAQGQTNATLAYQAGGEILTISTRGDLERKLVTRAYDCTVLTQSTPDFYYIAKEDKIVEVERRTRTSRGSPIHQSADVVGGIEGPSTGSNVADEVGGQARSIIAADPDFQEAVDLILNVIEPLSWDVNGGEGSIFPYKGHLIVRASIGVHQQIEDLLGPSSVVRSGSPK